MAWNVLDHGVESAEASIVWAAAIVSVVGILAAASTYWLWRRREARHLAVA